MSRDNMKSDACRRSRSPVSKWIKESCWNTNCYDKLRIILIRSLIRMLEIINLRMKIYTLWKTVIANTTTLPHISPTSTITWATWKVQKAVIRMVFFQPRNLIKTHIKRVDPRAGENHKRKGMCLIRLMTATFVEDQEVPMMIFTGRWDL